jgi:hypothetical protein
MHAAMAPVKCMQLIASMPEPASPRVKWSRRAHDVVLNDSPEPARIHQDDDGHVPKLLPLNLLNGDPMSPALSPEIYLSFKRSHISPSFERWCSLSTGNRKAAFMEDADSFQVHLFEYENRTSNSSVLAAPFSCIVRIEF